MNNFNEGIEYDMISTHDPRICDLEVTNKNTIIVHPRTFKKSLMMLQTKRAEEVREYYLLVEEILIDYLRYTQTVQSHNSSIMECKLKKEVEEYKQKAFERALEFDINPKEMVMTEYVYILTSQRYYRQHMFKIGKTTNPKQRLVGYNTGAAMSEDEMFYISKIPTFDCGGLEKMLHRALDNYRVRKEWFHIPQERMLEIVKLVSKQQADLCTVINEQLITEVVDRPKSIEMAEFEEGFITISECVIDNESVSTGNNTQVESVEQRKCSKCDKTYTSKVPYEKHIQECTGNQCMNCKQKFATKRDLHSHERRLVKCINPETGERTETKSYECKDCGLVLTTERRFVNHREGGCKYTVPCPHCGNTFKGKNSLDKHLRDNSCKKESFSAIEVQNPSVVKDAAKSDQLYTWINSNYERTKDPSNEVIKLKDMYAALKLSDFYVNLTKREKRELPYKKLIEYVERSPLLRAFYKVTHSRGQKQYRNALLGFKAREVKEEESV